MIITEILDYYDFWLWVQMAQVVNLFGILFAWSAAKLLKLKKRPKLLQNNCILLYNRVYSEMKDLFFSFPQEKKIEFIFWQGKTRYFILIKFHLNQ